MNVVHLTGIVLRGLLAAVVLIAVVVGVPAALLATVGNPVPEGWTWAHRSRTRLCSASWPASPGSSGRSS